MFLGNENVVNSDISRGNNLSEYESDIVADSSYMAAPFLEKFPDTKVIHIVRNPMMVVKSFLGFGYFTQPFPANPINNGDHIKYEEFMYSHLPELTEEMPQIDRACLYWANWNELIEGSGRVEYRHRIEDSVDGLSNFLGSQGTYRNTKCNSFGDGIKWRLSNIQSNHVKQRLRDVAKRYGYLSILFD